MSKNLFITSTEPNSGKSLIALGIMELLRRTIGRVGFFRPIINKINPITKQDNDIHLISNYYNLGIPYQSMYGYTSTEAQNLIALDRQDELLEGIFSKYSEIKKDFDFILCEGSDFSGHGAAFELDINAEIANNLGCPVLLVLNAHKKTASEIIGSLEMAFESFTDNGCNRVAAIINRTGPKAAEIMTLVKANNLDANHPIYTIPNEKALGHPTVGELAGIIHAEVLYGAEQLDRHVFNFKVAAMQMDNFLKRVEDGSLIITPGDRSDLIVACLASIKSMFMPNISGIVLTGGLKPDVQINRLIAGFSNMIPILSVKEDTFDTARTIDNVHSKIYPEDKKKVNLALELFEKNVNIDELANKIIKTRISIITPKMFEYNLLQKAIAHKQHIVLPEGEEIRILKAAEILLRKKVVDLTLLGDKDKIQKKINKLDLSLDDVKIIEVKEDPFFNEYAQAYYMLRKNKGITLDVARDRMEDISFFGTMMIKQGRADGMVSGAVHTTANTIRPAFQIIKTKPNITIVSSVFFMCLDDHVLVYGDCAVNPSPNAKELAEIAISSAQTANLFGIEPRIAMLSYSTGESGKGENVQKVREATSLAKKMSQKLGLDLKLEGPIQYDAAVDPQVANIKLPDSEVAGKATIFIFPDLNTGNNTYKAVQRSSGAVAIGPVMQGLNSPVNDLSRGCTVTDIVNTVAITAIQAQSEKGLL